MATEIKELETCKEALDKGLITQEDYDTAKATFLRCVQFTLGSRIGVVGEGDLSAAKVSACVRVFERERERERERKKRTEERQRAPSRCCAGPNVKVRD